MVSKFDKSALWEEVGPLIESANTLINGFGRVNAKDLERCIDGLSLHIGEIREIDDTLRGLHYLYHEKTGETYVPRHIKNQQTLDVGPANVGYQLEIL